MKKLILISLFSISLYSCGPSACDCLEIVDNKLPYFTGSGTSHAEKAADCYEKFSDEEYRKYTEADEWQKQAAHAERLQPIAREKMIKECNE
jgi:hypothetical protein